MPHRSSMMMCVSCVALIGLGCAGELTDDELLRARNAGTGGAGAGGAGTNAGGANGATGGAAGSGTAGGSPIECMSALMKAKSCAISGCHGGTTPSAELLLTDEALTSAKSRLVDQPNKGMSGACMSSGFKLIDSAHPEQSLLYAKMGTSSPCGARMPSTGAYLSSSEMSCVMNWMTSVIGGTGGGGAGGATGSGGAAGTAGSGGAGGAAGGAGRSGSAGSAGGSGATGTGDSGTRDGGEADTRDGGRRG